MGHSIGAVQAAAMLLIGIFLGQKWKPSLPLCLMLFGLSMAGGIFFHLRGRKYTLDQPPKKISRIFFCAAFLTFGMGRGVQDAGMHRTIPGSIENFIGEERISFTGTITAPPTVTSSRTTLRVTVDSEQGSPDSPTAGKLLLVFYSRTDTDFQYGNRVRVSGKTILPPDTGGSFSYRSYLERDGITAMINNPVVELLPGFGGDPLPAAIYRLRDVLLERVYQLFPKPENALMAGILLGDESKITSDVDHAFQQTGTAHIIAISGANFTVLTWLALSILRKLIHRWWAPIFMLPFIIFYTILVGGNAAVVRAAIMCGLSMLGMSLGRTGKGLNNLALSAALMGLAKPTILYDLGFQLSVTATLGILLFSGPIGNGIRWLLARIFPKMSENLLTTLVDVLNDLLILSVSAQIFTMWVSAQAFGRLSLISLPTNFLIAPFQSIIMLGGFAALILSFIFYPLGAAAAWLIWPAPALTIRIVERCAKARWGSVYFDLNARQAWLIIGLILALYTGRHAIIRSIRSRNFLPYLILLLGFSAVMLWTSVIDRMDQRTQIRFSMTGTSMTLNIRTGANRVFVIADGLTNYKAQQLLEKQILPVRRIPSAAWLDIPEYWMAREFTESGAADTLSLLYLNGELQQGDPGFPERIEKGFTVTADGIRMEMAASFMGKKSWMISDGTTAILFPNGIPAERIFDRSRLQPSDVDLIILGKRDEPAAWRELDPVCSGELQILDCAEGGNLNFYLADHHLFVSAGS